MKQTFFAYNKKIIDNFYQLVMTNYQLFIDKGQVLEMSVKVAKKKRTNPQNALYWALVGDVAEKLVIDGRRFSCDADIVLAEAAKRLEYFRLHYGLNNAA
jgi:hypothetical protein